MLPGPLYQPGRESREGLELASLPPRRAAAEVSGLGSAWMLGGNILGHQVGLPVISLGILLMLSISNMPRRNQ